MTRPDIARASPSHDGLRRPSAPRRALACRREIAAPGLALVAGSVRERGQPPSPLPLVA